jgi:hypothetical protein
LRLLCAYPSSDTIKLLLNKNKLEIHAYIVCLQEWRKEMIEEIIKLRGAGLSFRKIASELNTTVGRVQYRWSKWKNRSQEEDFIDNENVVTTEELESTESETSLALVPVKGELQIRLVSPRKVILFWEVSDVPKKIIERFFNRKFEDLVQVVRIYDVTDIIFNGKNAHHFYEITLPYNNGHWFVKGLVANRGYIAELGVHISKNKFFPLLRSNSVHSPIVEILNGNEYYHDFLRFQQYEDQPPKWIDHVSTYSYYEESKTMEEING